MTPKRHKRPTQPMSARQVRRTSQLHLESLEARRLLAGLQVSVFVDSDGSRDYADSSDAPAANRLVYIDLNSNGTFDGDEPISGTDANGAAFFENLEQGEYSIGLIANSTSQRQTTATRIAPVASPVSSGNSNWIISDPLQDHVWAIDGEGFGTRIQSESDRVDFGGPVKDFVRVGDSILVAAEPSAAFPSGLITFAPALGVATPIESDHIASFGTIQQLLESADGLVAVAGEGDELRVFEFQLEDSIGQAAELFSGEYLGVAVSPATSQIYVAERLASGSRVYLHDDALNARGSYAFDGIVDSLQFNATGDRLFVVMESGTVNVLEVSAQAISLEATLGDASGPIWESTSDGRLLTGSSLDASRIIQWDMTSWQPVDATQLPAGISPQRFNVDSFGDRLYVAAASGAFSVDLAVPTTTPAELKSGEVSEVRIGIRPVGSNTAPEVGEVAKRLLVEDSRDTFRVSDLGVQDDDGDALWFSLQSGPQNGALEHQADGSWNYKPNDNFAGSDEATFVVYDGMTTVDLILQWDVSPENDPPVGIHIQLPPLPENPEPGSPIGFISVEDPDVDPNYRVTTSDARFSVRGGQIYYVDGTLDFDVEPNVAFEVIATDVENSAYRISTTTTLQLTNVNESPEGITLQDGSVAENSAGADVGPLVVVDPDADSLYDFELSDPRFEVHDGILRLVGSEELNFESEAEVEIAVTATERNGTDSISGRVTVTVEDQNDAPTAIRLSGDNIEAEASGAIVGGLTVEDADGDHYEFSVQDSRFEVSSGVLKLRDGESIEESSPTIALLVSARARNGDSISRTFPINVTRPVPPHQNPNDRHDVDGDRHVSPLDALLLIDALNHHPGGPLPPPEEDGEPRIFPDVDGDGYFTARDVLEVIHKLNQERPRAEEEPGDEEYSLPTQYADVYGPQLPLADDDLERKETKLAIDQELEHLLDQLAKHKQSHS